MLLVFQQIVSARVTTGGGPQFLDQEKKMKKIFALALAACLSIGVSFASDKKEDKKADKEVKVTGIVTDPACAKSGDKAKMTDAACAKKCMEDGKAAFVNDKDGSVWAISNPEAVKGHEGHHVTLSGHANDADKSFHVMSVAMAKEKAAKKEEKKEKKS
jgi:hypothetical protein